MHIFNDISASPAGGLQVVAENVDIVGQNLICVYIGGFRMNVWLKDIPLLTTTKSHPVPLPGRTTL
ncbi:MAG: hypothetical protein BAJATHORv1_50219 [Candidatus Thorarchaeota archaeon]|nr:MAG: hypothetical protein BAJATHORv1_50219 [Candidatus Thorarchaeota archaeon]